MLALTKVYFHKIDGNKKGLQRSEEREVGWHLATRLVMKILLGSSMKISGDWNMKQEEGDQSVTRRPSHAKRGQEIKPNFTRIEIILLTAQ